MPKHKTGMRVDGVLLVVLLIFIVIAIGFQVYQRDKADSEAAAAQQQAIAPPKQTTTTTTTDPAVPAPTATKKVVKPTLVDAIDATKTVYNKLITEWGTQTEATFIQINAALFTPKFVQSSRASAGKLPLECNASINGVKPDAMQFTGMSSSGNTASVNVEYTYYSNGTVHSLLNAVNLSFANGTWFIDGLTCPSIVNS